MSNIDPQFLIPSNPPKRNRAAEKRADEEFQAKYPHLHAAMQGQPMEAVLESILEQQEEMREEITRLRAWCEGLEASQRGEESLLRCPICNRPMSQTDDGYGLCPVDGKIDPYRR